MNREYDRIMKALQRREQEGKRLRAMAKKIKRVPCKLYVPVEYWIGGDPY